MVVSPRRLLNLMRQFHHELSSDSFRYSCAAIDKGENGHAKVNDESVAVGSNNIFQLNLIGYRSLLRQQRSRKKQL